MVDFIQIWEFQSSIVYLYLYSIAFNIQSYN